MDSENRTYSDDEMKKILDYVSGLSVPSHITKEGAWENLHAAIRQEEERQEELRLRPRISKQTI